MADINNVGLFGRLKRLFGTDVIIRNVGNQLKTVDVDRIQAYGNVKTNALIDRFTKLHRYGANMPYNPTMNYQTLRIQLYTDYEAMDTESIIASALDIISDESTLKNEAKEVIQIRSADENIQQILYNLFYDVLNIEFNLWLWVRNMCKYGDFYLHLEIAEKFGIYHVTPMSVYDMVREEGMDPQNPSYVCFKIDPMVIAAGGINSRVKDRDGKIKFENYEIAHFRLLTDANYLPYGRCAAFDTKIYTENSVKEIKDIVKGDKVWTYNIEENKYELANVLNTVNSGVKRLYKINTIHNEIRVTDNHPMLVWDLILNKPVYKQIKELIAGDYLCTYKNIDFNLINPRLNKTKLTLNSHDWKCDLTPYDTFPNEVTPEFARFFGFMLGDGWENETNHSIGFARGIRNDRNEYYESLLSKFSGKKELSRLNNTSSNVSNHGVTVNSKIFKHLMNINGFNGKSYSKRLPNWIWESDEETQLSLIKGLMDADGYIFTDKGDVNSYNLTLNNKELLKDIKTLLDRLKIKTGKIRPRKFTGKCIIKGVEYNAKQAYDFTFYLDGKRKQQYEKYNIINPKHNIELFRIKSIIEELPEETYDIQVDKNSNFIADGIIIHNSYIEPARKTYKAYILMKDAMLLHRISRAPEKRVFYVDIGNLPPNEVDGYMEKIKNKMKKTPFIDHNTGEYNLRYNQMNVMEDFYIPQRGSNSNTKIDTLKGLEYNAIDDVNFLRDEMLAALKIPKAFFGFEKDLCISPDTKIPLLDGRTIPVNDLINEYNNGKKNYVYSIDEKTNNIVPGEIEWAGFTRMNTQTVKVWLDNGEYIQCTPDHLFLTRIGEWKEAQHLIEGESLMPLYLQKSVEKKINGYYEVYHPSTGKYEMVHRLVANYYNKKQPGMIIHHSDCNKLNNNPENLDGSMDFWQHRKWHIEHSMLCHTNEANIKRTLTHKKLMENKDYAILKRQTAKQNSTKLVEWIKENGASRKGFVKNKTSICVGCGVIINNKSVDVNKRSNIYCNKICKQSNWKTKYKNIDIDEFTKVSSTCKNFTELRNAFNIKDSSTLTKLFKYHEIDKSQFIIKNMVSAHKNSQFMSQLPETNKFYEEHKSEYKNHKVFKIEWVDELIDTCDLTIKKYHNFGTAAGVIIHNSGKATLAAEDIRFARTVERIQRIILSELYKMALVHLYVQGYDGAALNNFELSLTTPSIIYEQEKVALWKEKISLAKDMIDTKLIPSDWIYDNVFQFSEDQYDELRDLTIEDMKRIFRLTQLENEGNDPAKSGKSYGTPHDLASMYGKGRNGVGEVPPGYDEKEPVGRPKEKASLIGTQQDPLGKDRLGRRNNNTLYTSNIPSEDSTPKGGSPLALAETLRYREILKTIPRGDKQMVFEAEAKQESSLLDEENIKGI
jgi:intein/homing endonuclease